jgi:lipopolysaccharide/colanic/teichoic acid biosynthesis glycosyltransferase
MMNLVWSKESDSLHFSESDLAQISGPERTIYRAGVKRVVDLIGSAVLALVMAPLICLVVVTVALQGGGVLYSHGRIGRGGRLFKCYKFRTMVVDADVRLAQLLESDPEAAAEWAAHQKLESDPRITRLGKFLRRSSLDELPQLWNVLRGDMSLVGPRPVTAEELKRYGAAAELYLSVRPGLTGLWQVNGRNSGRKISYAQRIAQDVRYITSIGFVQDIKIMFATVLCVLRMTGR